MSHITSPLSSYLLDMVCIMLIDLIIWKEYILTTYISTGNIVIINLKIIMRTLNRKLNIKQPSSKYLFS
jgi:hypothetical protein